MPQGKISLDERIQLICSEISIAVGSAQMLIDRVKRRSLLIKEIADTINDHYKIDLSRKDAEIEYLKKELEKWKSQTSLTSHEC